MLVGGKDGAHAIVAHARISSICAAALLSTIYICWLVLNHSKLIFRRLPDFSTGSLEVVDIPFPYSQTRAFSHVDKMMQQEETQKAHLHEVISRL
jgi:hypothetical protein